MWRKDFGFHRTVYAALHSTGYSALSHRQPLLVVRQTHVRVIWPHKAQYNTFTWNTIKKSTFPNLGERNDSPRPAKPDELGALETAPQKDSA